VGFREKMAVVGTGRKMSVCTLILIPTYNYDSFRWRQTDALLLSFERCLDQRHRRRAGPEFVADRAMVLKLTMGSKSEFYELYSTSKERFALDETMCFVTMKCN
jgi:hypothetical protein